MPGAPVVYRERWEVVTEEIRSRILRGEMLPGSRIRETELAEAFGVSRGPVREALRTLEVAGLVLRMPRQASYVAPVRRQDVDELYTLRTAIEELAIRRALSTPSPGMTEELGASVLALQSALSVGDLGQVVDSDIDFHSVFYNRADHRRLVTLWATLTDPLRIMMRLSSRRSDPDWTTSIGGHLLIAKLAGDGDVDGCVDATVEHLAYARELVIGFVQKQELQLP
jgi:GntR family transcriptional regulator of gluconate operon